MPLSNRGQFLERANPIAARNDGVALPDRDKPISVAVEVKEAHPWLTMLARHNRGEWLQRSRLCAGDGLTKAALYRTLGAFMHHAPTNDAAKLQRSGSQDAFARLSFLVLPGKPDGEATLEPGE